MLPIPPDVLFRYDKALSQEEIPAHQQPHYRRWLRFYLDFCGTYDLPALERESVRGLTRKLREKAQTDWKRRQAVDAVRPFFYKARIWASPPPGLGGRVPLAVSTRPLTPPRLIEALRASAERIKRGAQTASHPSTVGCAALQSSTSGPITSEVVHSAATNLSVGARRRPRPILRIQVRTFPLLLIPRPPGPQLLAGAV